jgi:hypothetical protein
MFGNSVTGFICLDKKYWLSHVWCRRSDAVLSAQFSLISCFVDDKNLQFSCYGIIQTKEAFYPISIVLA